MAMIILNGNLPRALEISRWLQIEKGLTYKKEFTWYRKSGRDEIVIECKDSSMESLIILTWA
jgi:hypothetical protein